MWRFTKVDGKLEQLSSLKLFRGLRHSDLVHVAKFTTACRFPAGKVLQRAGAVAIEAFVIAEGTVQASGPGGELARLGPGEAGGELALLTRSRQSATLTALTDVEVLVMNLREFVSLLAAVPELRARLLGVSFEGAVAAARQAPAAAMA